MEHSNQIREYLVTDNGIEIRDVNLGPSGGLLMGSSRAAQEAKETGEAVAQSKNMMQRKRELESKLKFLDAQITELNSEFEIQKEELDKLKSEDTLRKKTLEANKNEMARIRRADII
jgi:circadian clock protein KaiC